MVRTHGRRGELNEWEEDDQGTLTGPALEAGTATINEQSARIYATSSQPIPDNTVTQLSYDSADAYSPGSILTIDTANNKVVIEQTGLYLIKCRGGFNNNVDGTRTRLSVNVDGWEEDVYEINSNGRYTYGMSQAIVQVSTTPVDVTATIFQNSGGSLDTSASEKTNHLDIARLG